jgi:hypothetical protein
MSALGHKRTLTRLLGMCALPLKADIRTGPVGIAYYYWIGTQDMLPVFVAAGIMMLAGAAAGYVGANTETSAST